MAFYRNPHSSSFPSEISDRVSAFALDDLFESSLLRNKTASKVNGTEMVDLEVWPLKPIRSRSAWEKTKDLSGAAWVAITASFVLVLNVVLLLVVLVANFQKGPDGLPALFPEICEAVSRWSQGLHYTINIFATILLGASNYFMQRLSSCTRNEVDLAHQKGSWVDVGISSVRNMRFMTWERITLWWILAISSLPIHLLYNSAVFETTGGNLYRTAVVSSSFIDSGNRQFAIPDDDDGWPDVFDFSGFKNVSNSHCIQQYSAAIEISNQNPGSFVTNSGSVIAVTSDPPVPSDVIFGYSSSTEDLLYLGNFTSTTQNFTSFSNNFTHTFLGSTGEYVPAGLLWVCRDLLTPNLNGQFVTDNCDVQALQTGMTPWSIDGHLISYCLVEQQPTRCTVEFSTTILIVVVISNALKVACMVYTICRVKYNPLVTIGDAIASFLYERDAITSGRCLWSKEDAQSGNYASVGPKKWQKQRKRWFHSTSWQRWIYLAVLIFATLAASIYLLALGIHNNTSQGMQTGLKQFGASEISGSFIDAFPTSTPSVLQLVLIANTPQFLVSLAYVQLNAIASLMLANAEWASFASKRKPLRVSSPEGQQRSTYWFQLPHKYSIPILVTMATLHWAISQSIYLVKIAVYQEGEQIKWAGITSLGWTPGALLLSVILGGLLFMILVGFGTFRRYPAGLPLLGGCSLVVSAACHARADDKNVELGPVQWGVVGVNEDGTSHCGFASDEVRMPYEGELCA